MFGQGFCINGEYKYNGKKMDAESFSDMLITLYDHNTFTKSDAINTIHTYHSQKGGDLDNTNWEDLFNIAVNTILQGYLFRIGDDTYKLSYTSTDDMVDDMELDDIYEAPNITKGMICDMVLGTGKGAVYVYYYDTHKDHYTKDGSKVWPCKIGMSFTDPMKRIFSQIGTASPERPHPALIIYTDKPRELETMIHAALKVQGAQIDDSPSREWFMTNPDIVKGLYERMLG